MEAGILKNLISGMTIPGTSLQPRVEGNEIIIELDEKQLAELMFRDVDPRYKPSLSLRVLDGRVVIRIKLW